MQIETKLFVEENDEEFEDIPDDEEKSEIPPEIAAIKAKEAEISGDDIYENDLVTLRVTLTRANVLEGDQAPPVHAVHMPKPLRESWWVILTDPTAPDGKGNIHAIEKIQNQSRVISHDMRFMAPPKVGTYKMELHCLCDAYSGIDQKIELEFTVKPQSELPEYVPHPEDVELDNEPTLFEQVMQANMDSDSSDDEDEEDATGDGGDTNKQEAGNDDDDDDDDDSD